MKIKCAAKCQWITLTVMAGNASSGGAIFYETRLAKPLSWCRQR